MNKCEECGKKLGFFEGYHHPTMGRNHLLCSNCFDIIHDSVVKWREANLPYVGFFNNYSSNNRIHFNLKNKLIDFIKKEKIFGNSGMKDSKLITDLKTLM